MLILLDELEVILLFLIIKEELDPKNIIEKFELKNSV